MSALSRCGDIEQCRTPLGVPNWEVVDTLWGILHCSMSSHRDAFKTHIVQGGFPATCVWFRVGVRVGVRVEVRVRV